MWPGPFTYIWLESKGEFLGNIPPPHGSIFVEASNTSFSDWREASMEGFLLEGLNRVNGGGVSLGKHPTPSQRLFTEGSWIVDRDFLLESCPFWKMLNKCHSLGAPFNTYLEDLGGSSDWIQVVNKERAR